MPALDNHKHELFAQQLAQGESEVDAYEAVYESRHRGNASRLRANESVQRRIHELQQQAAEECGVTLRSHLETLEELRNEARQDGSWAAAINAEVNRGKASGLYVERTENINYNKDVTPEEMPAEQWEAEYTSDARH